MTMSIKAHIEAGHYDRDEKGRALVPMRLEGAVAEITFCADRDGLCIVGWTGTEGTSWDKDGRWLESGESNRDLLPPPPRKREVKAWVLLNPEGAPLSYTDDVNRLGRWKEREPDAAIVELTGSYEKWS